MHGTHHPAIVALSILIAIVASYAALDLAGRVAAARDRTRLTWLAGGSIAMGVGIWSMHFTAMLAYRLPVPIAYDPGLTLLSLVIAIGASLVALVVAARATAGIRLVLTAGLLMAAAISGMHYVGMAGVRVSGRVDYLRGWVVASLAVALVASVAALWLARYFRHGQSFRSLAGKMISAVVMGFAITGMHYTAMEAVLFTHAAHATDSWSQHLLAPAGLTLVVVVGTLVVLALALLAGFADRMFRARMDSAHPQQRREQLLRTLAVVEVGIVIVAVAAIGGLGYAVIDQTADAEHHQTLLHLNERGQTHVTLSHLWLEEALHGDDSFDVEEEVFGNLNMARRLCGTTLRGRETARGGLLPSGGPHVRGRIPTLCGQLEDLLSLTRERLADPEAGYAGGLSDHRYDALFREILANSEAIDRHHRQMLAQIRRLTTGTLAAMLLVLVLFAGLLLTVTIRARRMLRGDDQELQRLASIVGSSHDAIALTSHDGTILNWNPGAERIFGYSAAEAVGRSMSMLVPEEAREREKAIRDRVRRGEWVSSYETVRLRRDGGRVDLSLSLAPVQDAYGGVIAISSIGRDITERKQAEKALQRKEEYFRALIENGSDLVYILDSEDRVRYIGPSVQPLLGYTPEEVIGRSSFEFVHPDDQHDARGAITDDFTTEKDGGTQVLRLRDSEGGWHTFEARGSNLLNDPSIRGIVVNAHDITERVEAEQKLQARERQLADAQRIAGLGSWDYDLVTGKVRWSKQMYRNFGLDPAVCEVTYEQYMERIHPDDREQVRRAEELSAQHQVKPPEEYRVVWPDGTERVLQELGGADYGPDGKPIRLFGTAQDITERKRVEEALVRAKEEAEAADRAKSEFLSSMSHELRTPLNSVIGFSKVLAKNRAGNLLEQDLGYLERIRSNGMHLLGLINDVLDLSRIEAGKMELDLAPVQVESVLADVVEQLGGAVRVPGLELRLRAPEGVAPLKTDAGKLKQVLINLVGNAIKFTERGSVTVSLEADAETGLPVRIDVRDTGIGIPPERLSAIFQAFEQAESGTARRYGGTGLGLAISSSLVELMGFRLEVESIPGDGSTFSILLADGQPGERASEAHELEPAAAAA